VLELYRDARARGVAVFFITGRPPQIRSSTETNLRMGYDKGWDGLHMKPADTGTQAFKAGTRTTIDQRGFDIVANVGDQESDLDGGRADRAFKTPNPFYFIAD
jgi:putative acid phosphatase of HAD superfamily subfamily IIIB